MCLPPAQQSFTPVILPQVHQARWSEEPLAEAARKEPAFPMLIQTAVIMPLDSQQKMDAQKGRAG